MSPLFLHQEYPPHLQAQQLALEPLLERQKQVKLHCHRTVNHTLNELRVSEESKKVDIESQTIDHLILVSTESHLASGSP